MFNKKEKKPESNFSRKIKVSINNQKQYKIFESKQFKGIILLLIFSFLLVVSIVQVSGFSTINSYTVGMLFGYYSYFIYIAFIVLGLCWIFQIDVKIEKFLVSKFKRKFYFSWLPYLFFSLGMALIIESIKQIVDTKDIFPGAKAFKNFFESWWESFTDNKHNRGAVLPNVWNAGIIVSLFMSLLVCWSGYIISIIIGLAFIAHFAYYIFYGSLIKKIRVKVFGDPNKKDKVTKEEFEEYKTKIMDLSFEDQSGLVERPDFDIVSDVEAKTKTINIEDPEIMFPVESISEENLIDNPEQEFVNKQTNNLNLEKNITTEFKLENEEIEHKKLINDETFDFELDIFETKTSSFEADIMKTTNIDENFEIDFDDIKENE